MALKTTVADKLKAFETERDERRAREDFELMILRSLPADMPAPTISNVTADKRVSAWLSFRLYAFEGMTGADILAALESAGYVPMPATLVQYGNWRRSPHMGFAEDLPETSSNGTLTDCEPIAPLWLVPHQHIGPEAQAFYKAPSGHVVKVTVPAMAGVGVSAVRREVKGTWYFERGTARVQFPSAWHSVEDSDGTPIAAVSVHSRGYVDTEQGVSGAIYFTPYLDHRDWKMTPSEFFRRLLVS